MPYQSALTGATMPEPLDLDAILELCPCVRRQTHADTVFHGCDQIVCNCYYLGEGKDTCLWPGHETLNRVRAVIEALRDALTRVPEHPHAGMCQFRPPYSQLGPRPCTCYIGKIQVALALVTGGRDA